ncbi:MAG: RimK family alpha-L-glutamate ligase [bacterium]|nr:RimK family alpha-L-glutamate ligase [bacterium]
MQILLITHDPRLRQYRTRELVRRLRDRHVDPVVLAPRQALVSIQSGRVVLLGPRGPALRPDLVLNALYLRSQRDLDAVRAMEGAGYQVINRADAWYAAKVKPLTAARLTAAGLPHPTTLFSRGVPPVLREQAAAMVGWVVVKPWNGALGHGIRRFRNRSVLLAWLRRLAQRGRPALVQGYVPNPGRDIRVLVIGGEVVGATYRVATGQSWRTNVAAGATPVRCEPTYPMRDLAVEATWALGLDIAGVDLMEGPDGLTVLELNAWPDYERFDKVAGVDVADHLARYLVRRATKSL